nr:GGDEF domain-containing protein [Lysobacter sp. CAU 1642]
MAGGVAACLGVTYLVGLAGNFWTFPVLVGLYAVLPIRAALGLGCALTLTVVWVGKGLPTVVEVLSFAVTGVLVSGLAAISAYHVGRQRQALELAAATDALTGVGNRRRMSGDLEQSARLACRGSPLPALMVLDLDHFKRINDECGHEMGDRVLIEFANVVGKTLRQTDSLYRMGGEEFLVLLPMVEPTGIALVAEKVRARVEEQLRSPLGPVTVSIGAALYRRGESVAEWIHRADTAVYEAKAQGRNGWSIAPRIDGRERD